MMIRKSIRGLGVLGVLLGVLLATSASAADPGLVARDVYAGGGPEVSAGDFRLVGTAGEAIVAPISTTGDFQQGAGFWAKLPPDREVFLPHILR